MSCMPVAAYRPWRAAVPLPAYSTTSVVIATSVSGHTWGQLGSFIQACCWISTCPPVLSQLQLVPVSVVLQPRSVCTGCAAAAVGSRASIASISLGEDHQNSLAVGFQLVQAARASARELVCAEENMSCAPA